MDKDLVCHPCRHGKMVSLPHPPVNQVMTSHPGELLHMDTVGPARERSVGGKWYILVIVDDFLGILGFSSWRLRMRLFSTFETLP